MKPKTPIRLSIALLKHLVSTTLGEETLQVLADGGLGEVQDKLDAWLDSEDQAEALSEAMMQADAYFEEQVQDGELQQWMRSLPLRDMPALQEALETLPERADEGELEASIHAAMTRDWPGLNDAQIQWAARFYLVCLRQALLPLEEQVLTVVGRSVLRTEERLRQLQSQLDAWMAHERERCDRATILYQNIYQQVVLSGDVYVTHNHLYFMGGSMWEHVDQLLAGSPPLQPEEEAYLRLLRDECDRLPLAEDERQSHRDRNERTSLDNVYVDLSIRKQPTPDQVRKRLRVPKSNWLAIERFTEVASYFERNLITSDEAINMLVEHIVHSMDISKLTSEPYPLNSWVKSQEEFVRAATVPLTALEVLAFQPHLVLLGAPGSGKSTFVNHLAYTLAGGVLEENAHWRQTLEDHFESPLFPLRVVVRRWSSSLEPEDHAGIHLIYRALEMLKGGMTRDMLKARLHSPYTLIMFDGLDEAPMTQEEGGFDRRRIILDSVKDFCVAYPHCRVLVTSRIKPYKKPEYQLSSIPNYTLDELDDPRIQRFVERWYGELIRIGELDEGEAKTHGDRLLAAMQVRSDLREMAGTPLLLTMFTLVNRRAGLPENRANLYFEVAKQLLWEWEKLKAEEGEMTSLQRLLDEPKPPVTTIDLEKVLWRLTFNAHARSGKHTADLRVSDLHKALAKIHPERHQGWAWASRVIELMQERSGLLVAADNETFTFPHRSFQEYLASRWLLAMDDADQKAVELASDDAWWEVILLACGHLASTGSTWAWNGIVGGLADAMEADFKHWQAPLLAGLAWRDYGFTKVSARAERRLRKGLPPVLTAIMQNPDLPPAQRLEAGLIVADLGVLPPDLGALIPVSSDKLDYDFSMGKYLVTNAQYRRFMKATKHRESYFWDNPRYNRSTQPVVGVSWDDASEYCQWLSEVWRAEDVIGQDEMVLLPTEAEWQAAAGEGRYNWGNDFTPANCNSKESELDQPSPVHMYPSGATSSGIHDLCGNVWEWSLDNWREGSEAKVLRGGAFYNDAGDVTSAARWNHAPYFQADFGFRVVVVPSFR